MKPTPYPTNPTKPWRVSVPGRFFASRKRKAFYFADRKSSAEFCVRIRKFGLSAVEEGPRPSEAELKAYEPLVQAALARLGNDPVKLFEAITDYERNRLNIKRATVREAVEEFMESRKKKVTRTTWKED